MNALLLIFERHGLPVPVELIDWDQQVATWCDEYCNHFSSAHLSEISLDSAVFIFDHDSERVVLAYALSARPSAGRDMQRMRGFPDVNLSVRAVLGEGAFPTDRGHLLGHASGGRLDINLFPQRREVNRGWSEEGKRFRAMEQYASEHVGTFMYHRPVYDDGTWIPQSSEYGLLDRRTGWWLDRFTNR